MKDDRLHKLLGFIIHEFPGTGVKFDWAFEELVPCFKKSNIHEIGELCGHLAADGLLELCEYSIHLDHNHLRWSRQAYHGKKYKVKINWGNIINYGLGSINVFILIYSSLIAYTTDDKVDTLTSTIDSLTKHIERTTNKLDSLEILF
jgi:hypothetical protein